MLSDSNLWLHLICPAAQERRQDRENQGHPERRAEDRRRGRPLQEHPRGPHGPRDGAGRPHPARTSGHGDRRGRRVPQPGRLGQLLSDEFHTGGFKIVTSRRFDSWDSRTQPQIIRAGKRINP